MKILIAQPNNELIPIQLEQSIQMYQSDICLFPEGYLKNEQAVFRASELAKQYQTTIITGYKDLNNKDRALIIGEDGQKVLQIALDSTKKCFNASNNNLRHYQLTLKLKVEFC